MKRRHGIGSVQDRHRERLVHTNKSHIDIRERADFENVAGVAADEDPFAADGQQVTVARPYWMVQG